MDFEQELRRQWEVNVYHDLGFICSGSFLEETDRGHKNEKREATAIEQSLWEKYYHKTPKIPIRNMPDDIDLTDLSDLPLDVEAQSLEGEFIWLENMYDIVLLKRDTDLYCTNRSKWRLKFSQIKEIRVE
jgi:hypothetical protein